MKSSLLSAAAVLLALSLGLAAPAGSLKAERPPTRLRTAVEAYFAREYDRSLAILAETRFTDRRAVAHAHLLQAASRFTLYVLGGERDRSLLQKAKSDVRSCHRAAPELVPHPRFFSPRFRKFFDRNRRSG